MIKIQVSCVSRTLCSWVLPFCMLLFFFFFGHAACGISASQPGIEPLSPALEAWSFNFWTIRYVPVCYLLIQPFICCLTVLEQRLCQLHFLDPLARGSPFRICQKRSFRKKLKRGKGKRDFPPVFPCSWPNCSRATSLGTPPRPDTCGMPGLE